MLFSSTFDVHIPFDKMRLLQGRKYQSAKDFEKAVELFGSALQAGKHIMVKYLPDDHETDFFCLPFRN